MKYFIPEREENYILKGLTFNLKDPEKKTDKEKGNFSTNTKHIIRYTRKKNQKFKP